MATIDLIEVEDLNLNSTLTIYKDREAIKTLPLFVAGAGVELEYRIVKKEIEDIEIILNKKGLLWEIYIPKGWEMEGV